MPYQAILSKYRGLLNSVRLYDLYLFDIGINFRRNKLLFNKYSCQPTLNSSLFRSLTHREVRIMIVRPTIRFKIELGQHPVHTVFCGN